MGVLNQLGNEAQEEDLLCWAAVSAMAVRAFPEDALFTHPSQRDVVIYRQAGIKKAAKLKEAQDGTNAALQAKLANAQIQCAGPGPCNFANPEGLHLFDVNSTQIGDADKALTPEHFAVEIDARKCPVAIRWRYQGSQRGGDHALIVTGYDGASNKLRVWDPWPALLDPDPNPGQREKWIPYETYLGPKSDEGLDAVAQHKFDEFRLRRAGTRPPRWERYPEFAAVPAAGVGQASPVQFQGGLPDLSEPIDAFLGKHTVLESSGDPVPRPYVAGDPFPIIPLEIAQLHREKSPESLLKPKTSAVVVPILKDRQVIDSFLMLHDRHGWRVAGYSNNKIAGLLMEARNLHASPDIPAHAFYLVSIPELSKFFVAHGFTDRAQLAPLNVSGQKRFSRGRFALEQVVASLRDEFSDSPVPR